jgi:hypothetical protein
VQPAAAPCLCRAAVDAMNEDGNTSEAYSSKRHSAVTVALDKGFRPFAKAVRPVRSKAFEMPCILIMSFAVA